MPEEVAELRAMRPDAALMARMQRLAGPDGRYRGLSEPVLIAGMARWAAIEARAAAEKLIAMAEIIRRNPEPGGKRAPAGDMPHGWEFTLAAQAAMELAVSPASAEWSLSLAWALAVRLPLTLRALRGGVLDLTKARMIANETMILSDAQAGEAERLLAPYWAGRTRAQIQARLSRIVVNLDPDAIAKLRERQAREQARVRFWRDASGNAGLAGYCLPPDEALQANARIQARARAYRKAGIEGSWELLRVRAFLDMLNGTDARRASHAAPGTGQDSPDTAGGVPDHAHAHGSSRHDDPADDPYDDLAEVGQCSEAPGDDHSGARGEGGPGDGGPGDGGPGDGGPGDGGPGDGGPGDGRDEYGDGLAANLDLTIPLGTLLGLYERAGHAEGLGTADPALSRQLASAAVRNPGTQIRLIITNPLGHAVGFGIAKEVKRRKPWRGNPQPPGPPRASTTGQPGTAPAGTEQGNGTAAGNGAGTRPAGGTAAGDGASFGFAPADQPALPLAGLHRAGLDRAGLHRAGLHGAGTHRAGLHGAGTHGAVLYRDGLDGTDLPGGLAGLADRDTWGTWRLAAVGREWEITIVPVPPAGPCDHLFRTTAYRPTPVLRALVAIRDGACANPACARPAAECDWEHATPWPEGPTCSCNGGPHCRKDHLVKQAPGWHIDQLPDGRRTWTTPAGLRYSSTPRDYPD